MGVYNPGYGASPAPVSNSQDVPAVSEVSEVSALRARPVGHGGRHQMGRSLTPVLAGKPGLFVAGNPTAFWVGHAVNNKYTFG